MQNKMKIHSNFIGMHGFLKIIVLSENHDMYFVYYTYQIYFTKFFLEVN